MEALSVPKADATTSGEDGAFVYEPSMEPHKRRRLEIIQKYPEIAKLQGHDHRTIWVTFGIVAAQFGLAGLFSWLATTDSRFGSWWVMALVAYFVGGMLAHWCGQVFHETSHNLACKTTLGNRLLAIFANLPILFPVAMTFRRNHIDHHRYLGVDSMDTDLPLAIEVDAIGRSSWKKAVWLLLYFFVYGVRGATFMKKPDRWEWINLALQMAMNVGIWFAFGPIGFAYLAISVVAGHSLHPVAAHFIHEHYVFEPGQETYSYYGPLNWVTFNVGYHVEHHDFMRVPGWRLPELHAIAPEYYRPLKSHMSWTYVLWHFITSEKMSVANRIVRKQEDYERGATSPWSEPMPNWTK